MIEVLLMPCGRFQWFLISHQARTLVYGTLHDCDIEANAIAKVYRELHKRVSTIVDTYLD